MYKRIPKDFISDVIDRINIVDYVSQYAHLKPVGQRGEKSAKCPLPGHKDDTPSFYVNEAKQTFKCHGCGAGGGIVDFIKEYHGHEFVKTIEEIADFLGVKIPYESNERKDGYVSYQEIYQVIYNSAQTLCIGNDDKPSGLSDELVAEVGIIPMKPSVVVNVCKIKLKDKPELANNILENLPRDDESYFVLPIRTQFSETIECLYLFNDAKSAYLPSRPSKSYNKLIYNSHRYSKSIPKKSIHVFPDPLTALFFQSQLSDESAVIATVDGPEHLSAKVFQPFTNIDGFLESDELIFSVDISQDRIKPLLEQYLRISSPFAARTSFHFYDGKPAPSKSYDILSYTDMFTALCEEHVEDASLDEEVNKASLAKYIEYLMGGKNISSNLNDYLRSVTYDAVGRPDLLKEHYKREYTKPSSNVVYESLAVSVDKLTEIKSTVNDIIIESMDVTPEDIREKIKHLKGEGTSNQDLYNACLDKLNLLSYKTTSIKMESFLDNLSDEEKAAYMTPIENEDICKML